MTDYRPIIDQVAELLGAENYGDVVPRLTAVLEMAALWEETSRRLYTKLSGDKPEWRNGYHPDYILFDMPRNETPQQFYKRLGGLAGKRGGD